MKIYVIQILVLGFVLRLMIAIWNGYFGPSFGAELDALAFHQAAIEVANNPTFFEFQIGWIYSYILGLLYYVTTDSLFFGGLLSCVTWTLSAILLAKSLDILTEKRDLQVKALLIYALLPSSILFTSVTLREPYQMFFVNLMVYAALKIYLHKSIHHWFTLVAAIIGAGVLHGALMAFGIIFVVTLLFMIAVRENKVISFPTVVFLASIAVLVLGFGFSFFIDFAFNLEDGLISGIERFQQGGLSLDARTFYKSEVSITGFWDLLIFIPVSLLQYLFEPFPWHITSAGDVGAMLENMLRGWLIWKALQALKVAPLLQRNVLLLMFFSYLTLEAIWSIGTISWGTSVRHHLPAFGLLLMAAYSVGISNIKTTEVFTKLQIRVKGGESG